VQHGSEVGLTSTTDTQREFPWWQGVELAGQFNHDGQRSQGADIQFIQVVASDVFDDAPAGLGALAIDSHNCHTQEHVACRTIQ
jgi:hypothetical protein